MRWTLPALFFLYACQAVAQVPLQIKGVTVDSLGDPLSYVNIINQRTRAGTSTDLRGQFSFFCHPGDTILFSRVGYRPYEFVAEEDERNLLVMLFEQPHVLSPVVISGTFKPQGADKWQEAVPNISPFRNVQPEPGEKMLPTFGPGAVLNGPISRFSKSEKERKKAREVDEYNRQSLAFRKVIQSDETKSYLMNLFELSEEDYFQRIELFNKEYPEAYRLETEKEILDLLVAFFASRKSD